MFSCNTSRCSPEGWPSWPRRHRRRWSQGGHRPGWRWSSDTCRGRPSPSRHCPGCSWAPCTRAWQTGAWRAPPPGGTPAPSAPGWSPCSPAASSGCFAWGERKRERVRCTLSRIWIVFIFIMMSPSLGLDLGTTASHNFWFQTINPWGKFGHRLDNKRLSLKDGYWPVDDGDEGPQHGLDVGAHPLPHLDADLPSSPGRVVAHGDVLGVQVPGQDRHEVCIIVMIKFIPKKDYFVPGMQGCTWT